MRVRRFRPSLDVVVGVVALAALLVAVGVVVWLMAISGEGDDNASMAAVRVLRGPG